MPASLRDIARETGLSVAAVSQALRGEGRLSPETRKKIRAAADALGYRPDPLLSKVFSQLRYPGERRYRETLALVLEWKTENAGRYQKEIDRGVRERAAAMGYQIEAFVVSGSPAQHRRLSNVLRSRGIRGVIIVPRLGVGLPRLHLQWQYFAAVQIGRTLWQPRNLHHVATEAYENVWEALHLLKKAGYRRIGMAVEPEQNRHQNGVYYAAYLASQLRQREQDRLPILAPEGPWNERAFAQWFKEYKPDVLVLHRMELVSQWLQKLKIRVPEDLSLFYVNAQKEEVSGLRRDYLGMGRSAVEMISILLANDEIGLPFHPRSLKVDEFWQPGTTLSKPIDRYISKEGALVSKRAHAGSA